jgi:large subunit ribosomal protein L4
MKVTKYSINGKAMGEVDLPDSVFGSEINDNLIYELVKAANANLRHGTHSTKTRANVRGGGAKPWKQKGTGRARAGTSRSPIWKGGGTTHGPLPRDYRIELPKNIRRAAYRSIFSLKAKEGKIKIVEDITTTGKTKELSVIGKALSITKGVLITGSENSLLKRSLKNIPWFQYNNAKRISGRDIFYSKELIMTEDAIDYIVKTYSNGEAR